MEATTLRVIADLAERTAQSVRSKKGRTRGHLLGADREDERALDDLAGSWTHFARGLRAEAKKIEKQEAAMDRAFEEVAEDEGRYGSAD